MSELFINKEVEINVPVLKVWNVLVKRQYTQQWIKEFSDGNLTTEDWQPGSEIEMTDNDGNVIMKGKVTALEPYIFLKIEFENSDYFEVLRLSAKDNLTLLTAKAGPLAETEYDQHSVVWDKGLQKIKELSEAK